MTVIQLVSVLRQYGVDVLFLALGVTLLTSLLKKTVMKSVNKKVFVFLPFGLGILLYAVYGLVTVGTGFFTAEGLPALLEGGMSIGCAATLYYVIYEQFLRGKLKTNPLLPLLACIPEEKREEAADAILLNCKDLERDEAVSAIGQLLSAYADPPLTEEELPATAELLAEYISDLS